MHYLLLAASALALAAGAHAQQLAQVEVPGAPFLGVLGAWTPTNMQRPPLAAVNGSEEVGDSKLGNVEVVNRGSQFGISHNIGNGYGGWLQTADNNTILPSNSGYYATGGTTSLWALGTMNYPYYSLIPAPTCETTSPNYCANTYAAYQSGVTTGSSVAANWVFGGATPVAGHTTNVADGYWPQHALGTYTALNNPTANLIIHLEGDNDGTGIGGTDNPIASSTIADYQQIFTNAVVANRMVLTGDQVPRGNATVQLESHTVSGSTVTVTNTAGFIASEDFSNLLGPGGNSLGDTPLIDQQNTVWTRVSSCGSTTNTYSTASGGVYTFCSNAPTTAYITYGWYGVGSPGQTGSSPQEQVRTAYLSSNAADFQALNSGTLVDYGYPGALNVAAWPNNVGWDTWGALLNTKGPLASNGVQLAQDGALWDGVHPTLTGGILAAKKAASAIATNWPTMTASLAGAPKANNWLAAPTTGGNATYGNGVSISGHTLGNMPSLMLDGTLVGSSTTVCSTAASNGNLQIWYTGVKPQEIAVGSTVNGSNISTLSAVNGSSVTGGSINCTSGAWTVTNASAFASGGSIIVVEDPTNLITNGLMDPGAAPYNGTYPACPTNFTCTGNLPNGYSYQVAAAFTTLAGRPCSSNAPPCVTQAAITSGGTITDADGTWPELTITIAGVSTAQTTAINILQSVQNPNNAITAGTSALREGAYENIYAGPNGYLYGLQAAYHAVNMTTSTSYTAPWGTTAGTQLTCTGMNEAQTIYFDTLTLAAATGFAGSNGTYVPQRDVTDLCPTTNMTAGTITGLTSNEELVVPIGPFSVTVEVWRDHLNIRTQ